jgi:hypothetical protein
MTGVLSIVNLVAPPFQKVCGNCHVMDVIISPTGNFIVTLIVQNQQFQKSSFF